MTCSDDCWVILRESAYSVECLLPQYLRAHLEYNERFSGITQTNLWMHLPIRYSKEKISHESGHISPSSSLKDPNTTTCVQLTVLSDETKFQRIQGTDLHIKVHSAARLTLLLQSVRQSWLQRTKLVTNMPALPTALVSKTTDFFCGLHWHCCYTVKTSKRQSIFTVKSWSAKIGTSVSKRRICSKERFLAIGRCAHLFDSSFSAPEVCPQFPSKLCRRSLW